MRRYGRRRAPIQQRAQATHARWGQQRTPARRRSPRPQARCAQLHRPGRPVRQTHEQATLPAHRPMPLHRERAPRKRMRRLDDHHLQGQRSTQLTQSVWFFVNWRSARIGFGGTKLARSSPCSSSWHSHCASPMSVLRPGQPGAQTA
jgi:hypothetical protein